MTDKEKRVHDIALIYCLQSALRDYETNKVLNPDEVLSDYKRGYQQIMFFMDSDESDFVVQV